MDLKLLPPPSQVGPIPNNHKLFKPNGTFSGDKIVNAHYRTFSGNLMPNIKLYSQVELLVLSPLALIGMAW
jgi:hypothetical protein